MLSGADIATPLCSTISSWISPCVTLESVRRTTSHAMQTAAEISPAILVASKNTPTVIEAFSEVLPRNISQYQNDTAG
jgi:hypothetical protein